MVMRDQPLPFHLSANVALPVWPTATQNLGEEHETPDRLAPRSGLGALCGDHVLPFQLSTRALVGLAPETDEPTAMQKLRDVQCTADSSYDVADGVLGSGGFCELQPLSFQLSASI